MPLRIALVSLHTSPHDDPGSGDVGGMNVAVRHTALALAAAGHEVDVLTRRSTPDAAACVRVADGIRLMRLTAGPPEPLIKGDHEEYIGDFALAMNEYGPYDVVHSHHWFSGMAALPYARRRGLPHLQSYHSIAADPSTPLSEGERPESPGRLAGEARLARESDAIITVSRAERETVVGRLGADPARVHVVEPGVDARQFSPAADDCAKAGTSDALDGPPYVLVAARLEPLKGVDLAIRAIARIPAERRPKLIVSGGPTTGYEDFPAELRALAERDGVSELVEFRGPQGRDALACLIRGARALVVPSHSETYGLIALEGQACGTPVIAARAGGLAEALEDGRSGILVDSRDPDEWAVAIERAMAGGDEVAGIVASGLAHARAATWECAGARTLEVYREVLLAKAASISATAGPADRRGEAAVRAPLATAAIDVLAIARALGAEDGDDDAADAEAAGGAR